MCLLCCYHCGYQCGYHWCLFWGAPDEQEQLPPQDSGIKSQYPATQSIIPNLYTSELQLSIITWGIFQPQRVLGQTKRGKAKPWDSSELWRRAGSLFSSDLDLPPPQFLTCQVTLYKTPHLEQPWSSWAQIWIICGNISAVISFTWEFSLPPHSFKHLLPISKNKVRTWIWLFIPASAPQWISSFPLETQAYVACSISLLQLL